MLAIARQNRHRGETLENEVLIKRETHNIFTNFVKHVYIRSPLKLTITKTIIQN